MVPSVSIPHPSPTLFLRRIYGLMLRIFYLHIESWPRLIEVLYWPTINMLSWGFTSLYIMREFAHVNVVMNVMLAGMLLSETLIRGSIGCLMLFMEEVWARNLGHLYASPMRMVDYIIGLFMMSSVRMMLGMSLAVIAAYFLFGFSILSLGAPLALYIALLMINGWWYGLLLVSMLIRFGLAVEWLAWMGAWLTIPLLAPYYPVSILPIPLQYLSHALPATYVFQSMKSQVAGQGALGNDLLIALGLNAFYMLLSIVVFRRAYAAARRQGSLLQMGE